MPTYRYGYMIKLSQSIQKVLLQQNQSNEGHHAGQSLVFFFRNFLVKQLPYPSSPPFFALPLSPLLVHTSPYPTFLPSWSVLVPPPLSPLLRSFQEHFSSYRKGRKLIRKASLNYPRLTGTGICSHK